MFSITGEHDHTPFGGRGVQLVWGQRPDRELVHISEVERGKKCDCVCPACELSLLAKKGSKVAEHFAHQGGTACAGVRETNAHAWAKKVLGARKEIYLPPVIGSAGGKRLQTHAGRAYKFDKARLEKREGSIIPDVVLTDAEGRELIVEILVTHACDEAKIAKIREQGMPALEVDLSSLKAVASEEIVAEALVGLVEFTRAPRKWLHNEKIARATQRLETKLAREAAEREAARDREARAIIHAAAGIEIDSTDATLADMSTVSAYDRSNLIGIEIAGAHGFRVPTRLWQAAVLARVVFPAADEWGSCVDARSARDAIADCIAPAFRIEPASDVQNRVWRAEPGFMFPRASIGRYFEYLAQRRVLLPESHDTFRIDEDEAASIAHRGARLAAQHDRNERAQRRLRAIWDRIPQEDRGSFSLERWLGRPVEGFSVRLADLIEAGDQRWDAFESRLGAIERMFRDGTPAPEALGLPVGAEIERTTEQTRIAKEKAEAARQAADAQAARERVEWLTARAIQALGPVRGGEWLAAIPQSGIVSFAVLACGSNDGLDQARTALEAAERDWIEAQRREREAATARAELRRKAIQAFGPERAEVFLLATHPRIGMTPWARCADPVGLQVCLALLPRKATATHARMRGR